MDATHEGLHYDSRVSRRAAPETIDIAARYRERIEPGNYRWFYNERLYHFFRNLPPQRVLDVACGTGFFGVLLAQWGHEVVSIDISEKSIGYARQLAALNGANVTHHVMDISKLQFDSEFDYVTGEDCIHHLIKYPGAIENIYRALKPGGKAVFWEPFAFNPLFNLLRALNVRIKRHEGEQFLGRPQVRLLESVFDEVRIFDKSIVYPFCRFARRNKRLNLFTRAIDQTIQRTPLARFYALASVEMMKS
jgi:SAM-dependent methyltransferase